ncbi:hypothetical protein [Uliginosibacterium sp. H1]|uniref:hypothetical protein n=1 Tax=Uliginosibacterium sp. H1 TaxID=3114757 RepID=UPI002E17D6CE|nr:hypothetical protein [Uliginosibacterium sp. H1]
MRITLTTFVAAATIALALLTGCAKEPAIDADQAERAVPQFHTALNDGNFDAIYEAAAPALKSSQSQADFVRYLQAVRGKLGMIRGTERTGTRVEGQQATLTYKSAYEGGEATEEFVILLEPEKEPVVVSYRMLSPAL